MGIRKLMKFTGPRKLRNVQGLSSPLDCISSKKIAKGEEDVLVDLSISQGAFVSCHLCWGEIFGDAAVKNTNYGVGNYSI